MRRQEHPKIHLTPLIKPLHLHNSPTLKPNPQLHLQLTPQRDPKLFLHKNKERLNAKHKILTTITKQLFKK